MSTLKNASTMIQELEKSSSQLVANVTERKKKFNKLQTGRRKLLDQVQTLQAQYISLKDRHGKKAQEVEENLKLLELKLYQQNQEIEEAKKALAKKEEELKKQRDQNQKLAHSLVAKEEEISRLAGELKDLENNKTQVEKSVVQVEQSLSTLGKQLKASIADVSKIADLLSKTQLNQALENIEHPVHYKMNLETLQNLTHRIVQSRFQSNGLEILKLTQTLRKHPDDEGRLKQNITYLEKFGNQLKNLENKVDKEATMFLEQVFFGSQLILVSINLLAEYKGEKVTLVGNIRTCLRLGVMEHAKRTE